MYEDDDGEDDSDRDNYSGGFGMNPGWGGINLYDENRSELGNIIRGNFHLGIYGIRGGGDGNDVSQNDYMQDMSQENGSNDMARDAGLEHNCCPDPKPNFPGYRVMFQS